MLTITSYIINAYTVYIINTYNDTVYDKCIVTSSDLKKHSFVLFFLFTVI